VPTKKPSLSLSNDKIIKIKIAGIGVGIRTDHTKIRGKILNLVKNYVSSYEPDFFINLEYIRSLKPIIRGKLKRCSKAIEIIYNGNKRHILHSDKETLLQFDSRLQNINGYITNSNNLIILRYLAPLVLIKLLEQKRGAYVHACGVEDNNQGFLFVGPSGSGKSTIAKLSKYMGKVVLGNESLFIRKEKGRILICNSFWDGKKINSAFPTKDVILHKIFFIQHAKKNFTKFLRPPVVVSELIKNGCPGVLNSQEIINLFYFYTDVVNNVPCYRLGFTPKEQMWKYIENFKGH